MKRRQIHYDLIWSNPAFDYLFEASSAHFPTCFSQQIFREYESQSPQNTKSQSLFEVIRNFQRSTKETACSTVYELIAEIKDNSSANSHISFMPQSKIKDTISSPNVASIKIFRLILGDFEHFGVCITDLTRLQNIGLRRIQKSYQSTLINALSHERKTPLNAIINGCEQIQKKCKSNLRGVSDQPIARARSLFIPNQRKSSYNSLPRLPVSVLNKQINVPSNSSASSASSGGSI